MIEGAPRLFIGTVAAPGAAMEEAGENYPPTTEYAPIAEGGSA